MSITDTFIDLASAQRARMALLGITLPTPAPQAEAKAPSAAEVAEGEALGAALQALVAKAQPRHPATDKAVDAWLRQAITAAKRWGYKSLQLPFRNGSPLAGLFAGRLVHHVGQEVVNGKRPYSFWLDWGDEPGEYPDLTPRAPSTAEQVAARAEADRLRAERDARVAANRAQRHAAQPPKGPSGGDNQKEAKGKGNAKGRR
jgi:hypothetical protein